MCSHISLAHGGSSDLQLLGSTTVDHCANRVCPVRTIRPLIDEEDPMETALWPERGVLRGVQLSDPVDDRTGGRRFASEPVA